MIVYIGEQYTNDMLTSHSNLIRLQLYLLVHHLCQTAMKEILIQSSMSITEYKSL